MPQLILLRGAKQVLTLRGPSGVRRGAALHDLGIIEDGSVLIRDGIIAAVGSTRRLENLKEARTALEIPVNGRIVMPGFVDASLSLSLNGARHARKRKKAGEFYDESLALLRSCLQHGTLAADVKASADDHCFHSDISVLRKLAAIGSNPVRMIRTWRINGRTDSAAGETCDFGPTFEVLARRKLMHFIELTEQSQSIFDERAIAIAQQARIGIKLLWPVGSSNALADLLARIRPRAVCCCVSSARADELDVLARTPAITVFATGKDVFEGPAGTTARRVADAGGAIALSSGYDSSSAASFSMQMSIALAVVRLGLSTEEAFQAATINAAYAAGCGHLTGSLECGKQADALILNVNDYREVPRQFGINHVEMAIRQGSIVMNRTRWKAAAN
ncbi:MAG: amidohydrolase family protein [Acidobacteriaceae bacterium]|nr:amidohydrolase family protein [Acidobacteriaceae bacterium]